MLERPKQIEPAIYLFRAFRAMHIEPSPMLPWLESERMRLYKDNETETDQPTNNQRQGVLQAISQIIDFINNSRSILSDLETERVAEQRRRNTQ